MKLPRPGFAQVVLMSMALAAAACADYGERRCFTCSRGIPCTADFRAGINVDVRDAASGLPAAFGATGTIRDGDYVETLQVSGNDESAYTMSGAWERPGTYDVVVTKPGYRDWTAGNVVVTSDACHVRGVVLEVRLERLP